MDLKESINNAYSCSNELQEDDDSNMEIYYDDDRNISIYISTRYNTDDLYFKLFSNSNPLFNTCKCCRIKLFKAKYKKCNDSPLEPFILDYGDKVYLNKLMRKIINYDGKEYTLWEYILRMHCEYTENKKILRLTKKVTKNKKIPDYTKLR